MATETVKAPALAEIREARERLGDRVLETPVWWWRGREIAAALGEETQVFLKLEVLQVTGTFKPRGALLNLLELDASQLRRGVTAVSAGNHAIAVAYAASTVGASAKVVMPRAANPARVAACGAYGADVVLADDVHHAFEEVRRIEREERRAVIHPFEGRQVALGTGTLGAEWCDQVPEMDAVVVPIGGGGLIAGIANAVKQRQPACRVYGVEPVGAATMHRSFEEGKPARIERVETIADSLGAPHAEPYSFDLCRRFVDELVLVDDDELRRAVALLFREVKLAVEPAGAAATAAIVGPLKEQVRGHRVGVIACGSNIDPATYCGHLQAAG